VSGIGAVSKNFKDWSGYIIFLAAAAAFIALGNLPFGRKFSTSFFAVAIYIPAFTICVFGGAVGGAYIAKLINEDFDAAGTIIGFLVGLFFVFPIIGEIIRHSVLVQRRIQKIQAWARLQGCFLLFRLSPSRTGVGEG
jgi:hypothetical protein